MFILTRIISQLLVLNNFIKGSLNNAQDMRFLLLNYFATNETGKAVIKQLFITFIDMNQDLLFFNKIAIENAKNKAVITSNSMETNDVLSSSGLPSVSNTVDAASTSISSALTLISSVSIATNNPENLAKTKKADNFVGSDEYTINSMVIRAHKHLSELIVFLGKTFCSLGLRNRRGLDSQVIKDTHLIIEELFNGITSLLHLPSGLDGCFR